MREFTRLPLWRKLIALSAFITAYLFTAVFALRYLTENGVVAIFWPPTGLTLAALLVTGLRFLPLVLIAAFTANWLSGAEIFSALAYATANTVEGLVGWLLLSRLREVNPTLERARNYFQILLYGGIIAPIVGALIGATAIYLAGVKSQNFLHNVQFWWMGDSLGVIVLTPLFLIWRTRPQLEYSYYRWLEAALALSLTILFGQIVFAGWSFFDLKNYAKAFIFFIFVTWSALRFGRHATSIILLVIIAQIMMGVTTGKGYFFSESDKTAVFGTIWLYMTAISVSGMALAIYIFEARRLNRYLSLAHTRLEQVSEIAKIGGWEFDVLEKKLHVSRETLRILELPENFEIDAEIGLGFIEENERAAHLARGQLALEQGIGWDVECALRTRSGRKLWVRSQCKPIQEGGRVIRLIGTIHDLTEWRQSQLALQEREVEFRRLIETASEGIWTIDENHRTTFVNKKMAEMLGYTPGEIIGTPFASYIDDEREKIPLAKPDRQISEVTEITLLHRSGKNIHVLASKSPIKDEAGNLVGTLIMVTDISDRQRVQEELQRSEARYRELVDSLNDAIIVHQSGFIVYANEAAFRLVGAKEERELIGRNALDFVPPEYREMVLERMKMVNRPGGKAPPVEEQFIKMDGTRIDVEVTGRGIMFNNAPATMVVARDITESKRIEAEIRYLGQHDILTGLPNRILFADRMAQAIAMAERHKSEFALLFLDLDHFKKINDVYGHSVGDTFLRQVAERLSSCIRAIDTVSRQGGDEFTILLSELAHAEDAGIVAQKICDRLAESFVVEGISLHTSVSIGIAVYPKDGRTGEILLRNADIAMYNAKSRGRNQYQFFSEEMNLVIKQRVELEQELRKALAENQFYLVYQPQVNLQTGAIETLEVLLRWRHPQRGEILPGEFIAIAEESGQMPTIGEWILRAALSGLKAIDEAGHQNLNIAINASGTQLSRSGVTEGILRLLREYGIAPTRLQLELTESVLLYAAHDVANSIRSLSQQGVRFAIDDFGTGYSSLRYLKRPGLQYLKIDRSFIADLPRAADSAAIVKTIINLAHNLQLRTIAEGVETQEQYDFLRSHGCELMQGFYFSQPLEMPKLLEFLSSVMR